MKKYITKKIGNRYSIFETSTGNILDYASRENVRNSVRKLNNGAGFNGYTPAFLALETLSVKEMKTRKSQTEDVNTRFSRKFTGRT